MGNILAPGGGRPEGRRGTHTIKMREHVERLVEQGESPLGYMLKVMRAPEIKQLKGETNAEFYVRSRDDVELRLEAAKLAAPYVHPRIAQNTTVTLEHGAGDDTQPIDILGLAKQVAFLFKLAEHRPKEVVIPSLPAKRIN